MRIKEHVEGFLKVTEKHNLDWNNIDEVYKAALGYHISCVVGEAVCFTIICALIYSNIFSYRSGWF